MDSIATNYNSTATSQTGVTCTYPEPPPPQPAEPTCTIIASPTSIYSGDIVELTWETTHTETFSIDHTIGSVTSVAGGSIHLETITEETTFTGTATNSSGHTATCTVTVSIHQHTESVPYCSLSVSSTSIHSGGSATLTWSSDDAVSFSIDNGVGSVSPVTGGSTTISPIATTTYTGTAIGVGDKTVQCTTEIAVAAPPPPPTEPICTLIASPASVASGDASTLTWTTANASSLAIDNGIGSMTPVADGATTTPALTSGMTFTGTVINSSGHTATCTAAVSVTHGGGGGGGGGGSGSSGGGGGGSGGGSPPPIIALMTLPHVSSQPLAYLYLSQIPYTGLDLGPVGTVIYWIVLVGFALALAYFVLFGVAPFVNRLLCNFGSRVSTALNTQPLAPAPILHNETVLPEAPRGYSSYDGFKSFAQNGALSIEDIVKGLSQKHPIVANVEPIYENVEPICERVEPIATNGAAEYNSVTPDVRGFAAALVGGDRAAVFAGLRQYIRGSGEPGKLLSATACLIDDAYRVRVDGTACDPDIARLTARLSTATLEKLIAALATAIDSSYSTSVTGAKLALTRALAVLGA